MLSSANFAASLGPTPDSAETGLRAWSGFLVEVIGTAHFSNDFQESSVTCSQRRTNIGWLLWGLVIWDLG